MAELTPAAQKKLQRHLGQIRSLLTQGGHHPEEIDAATFGAEEQVHDLLDHQSTGLVDVVELETTLALVESPDDWAKSGRGEGNARVEKATWLGWLALAAAMATTAGVILAGVFSNRVGGDGGAVMSTIMLFGSGVAISLGILGRQHRAGRAALVVTAVMALIFLAVLAIAVFEL